MNDQYIGKESADNKSIFQQPERKLTLAFCLYHYFPFGGLQRDFLAIARVCLARGHQIKVFTTNWEGDQLDGVDMHFCRPSSFGGNHSRMQYFSSWVKEQQIIHNADCWVGFNKIESLDVYYAADTCFADKMRRERPAILSFFPRYKTYLNLESSVFSPFKCPVILMISKSEIDVYKEYYKTEDKRFVLLPPGISRDRAAPDNAREIRAEIRESLSLSEDTFVLLAIGSGFKTKGLDRSIQALAALPATVKQKTVLLVVGQDSPDSFKKLARKLDIEQQVRFLGGRHDVPKLLLSADCLLHPAYRENTGTALLEALVAGLPVLASSVCGYAHYIKTAKAGVVMKEPFDQSSFNKELSHALRDQQREVWRHNALVYAKKADIYDMTHHAVEAIERAAK